MNNWMATPMENRNEQMEQELQHRIIESAVRRHGGPVPADVEVRIAAEEQHITGNGYGTLFAAAAKLAAFADGHGYSVGFRGLIGNLYIAVASTGRSDSTGTGPPRPTG